jgi:protein-S-isoprenylcysteine O-methyltransferase Ste14
MTGDFWHSASSVVIGFCWGVLLLVWVAGALYGMRRTPVLRRAHAPLGLVIVFALIAWIGLRVVPEADWDRMTVGWPAVRAVGAALLLVSTAFALWARFVLGVLWSVAAVVKEGHGLRTNGPYAVTRHPIYTGILGMVLGTSRSRPSEFGASSSSSCSWGSRGRSWLRSACFPTCSASDTLDTAPRSRSSSQAFGAGRDQQLRSTLCACATLPAPGIRANVTVPWTLDLCPRRSRR